MSQPREQAQLRPSVGGMGGPALPAWYFMSRYAWFAGDITSFMPLATAFRAVMVPGPPPDEVDQYCAIEPTGGVMPSPEISAQPITVLPWPVTMPDSRLTSAA